MTEFITITDETIHKYQPGLVELLRDAVDSGASVSFLAPLPVTEAEQYWQMVAGGVKTGNRILVAATDKGSVIGSVQLVLATQPNAPHRIEIQKLLVHRQHRRKGIGRQLMRTAEKEAIAIGRTLLVLDTVRDSGAQQLYEQIGFVRVGIIPKFALSTSGSLEDTVVFYKLLR